MGSSVSGDGGTVLSGKDIVVNGNELSATGALILNAGRGSRDVLLVAGNKIYYGASMRTIFGGYIIGADALRSQLPIIFSPDSVTIDKTVGAIADKSGVLIIRFDPTPEIGPYELTLYAQAGQFLPMLSENSEDGDTGTRTLNDTTKSDFVCLLGERYPAAAAVTTDLQLVSLIFKKFIETGTVSQDILV